MTNDVSWCGVLSRSGGKYPTLTMVGGCGKPVYEKGQLIRWGPGEDAVIYHPGCRPDTANGRPPTQKVRNR